MVATSNGVCSHRLMARPIRESRAVDFGNAHASLSRRAAQRKVAVKAGYEANGGGFNNALGRLRTLELVEGGGEIRARDNLFVAG